MLYTGMGDRGTTKTFGCEDRISKSSAAVEALGTLDEVNSFLGLAKVKSETLKFTVAGTRFDEVIHQIQQNLFIIQAEVAGAAKHLTEDHVREAGNLVDAAEKELPPIKTFFISGGTELAALFDVARTLARRAERKIVAVVEEGKVKVSDTTLAYLNRLSSILYALARLSNHKSGINEEPPAYK
jgi:cob(I)alamin adenosyltransferase